MQNAGGGGCQCSACSAARSTHLKVERHPRSVVVAYNGRHKPRLVGYQGPYGTGRQHDACQVVQPRRRCTNKRTHSRSAQSAAMSGVVGCKRNVDWEDLPHSDMPHLPHLPDPDDATNRQQARRCDIYGNNSLSSFRRAPCVCAANAGSEGAMRQVCSCMLHAATPRLAQFKPYTLIPKT